VDSRDITDRTGFAEHVGQVDGQATNEDQPSSSAASSIKTPIIVISREHKLLPLAHRLRNVEGWPTEVVVWKRSYENAWEGMLKKDVLSSKREINAASVTDWADRANKGELVVVHDVPKLEGAFNSNSTFPVMAQVGVPSSVRLGLFPVMARVGTPSSIRLGFWWNGKEPQLPHLLVCDMGAWPGGRGRKVLGGLTLIAVTDNNLALWQELFGNDGNWIPDTGFKGLVNVGLLEERGKLVNECWETGWPDLHTQVFMSAVDGSWGELLTQGVLPVFTNKFTVGIPVSVPPWPGSSNIVSQARGVKDQKIDLNHKLHNHVYWHDVKVNVEEKALYTAGLDGLVGVVHASSNSFENALHKCLGIADLVGLWEKQFRSDIGGGVRMLESQLEEHYGVSF